jgi:hypothetical protein
MAASDQAPSAVPLCPHDGVDVDCEVAQTEVPAKLVAIHLRAKGSSRQRPNLKRLERFERMERLEPDNS